MASSTGSRRQDFDICRASSTRECAAGGNSARTRRRFRFAEAGFLGPRRVVLRGPSPRRIRNIRSAHASRERGDGALVREDSSVAKEQPPLSAMWRAVATTIFGHPPAERCWGYAGAKRAWRRCAGELLARGFWLGARAGAGDVCILAEPRPNRSRANPSQSLAFARHSSRWAIALAPRTRRGL